MPRLFFGGGGGGTSRLLADGARTTSTTAVVLLQEAADAPRPCTILATTSVRGRCLELLKTCRTVFKPARCTSRFPILTMRSPLLTLIANFFACPSTLFTTTVPSESSTKVNPNDPFSVNTHSRSFTPILLFFSSICLKLFSAKEFQPKN